MSFCSFQAQLVSIADIVAKAAEAEIKRRVEESCAVIRLELTRSRKDIDALKRKCSLLDSELRRVRGRGRRRVFQCGASFKTPRESRGPERTPSLQQLTDTSSHTLLSQISVSSLEEELSAPVIKQECQEGGNLPFAHEQQNTQQIQAQENTENQKPPSGASEIQNSYLIHSQTPTEQEHLGVLVKAEKDDEEPKDHLRFAQLWTTFPETAAEDTEQTFQTSQNASVFGSEASRNLLRPVEPYEAEQIDASDQMQSAAGAGCTQDEVDRAPAFGQKRFCCSFCEKSFSRFGQLKEHLRSHTGEKPFACAQCGRSFTKHCNLIRHAVVHSGEKPYQCAQCGKRFTQRSSLKSHQRTHSSAWHHHS